MTRPPELDPETKARIEAEEAYRRQIRASQPSGNTVLIGLVGAGALAVGAFAPALTAPVVGSINLIGVGNRDGIVLVVLAVLSVILALAARKWLIFTGLLASAFIIIKLVDLSSLRGNTAGGFVEFGWGWLPMSIGAVMLLWAGFTST